MVFEEFREYVRTHLPLKDPELFAGEEVCVREVKKNNGRSLWAVTVSPEKDRVVPVIYLDGFFREYVEGKKPERCLAEICSMFRRHDLKQGEEFRIPDSFDEVKDKIRIKLINYDLNRDQLEDRPHLKFGDLAVTFMMPVYSKVAGEGSIDIKDHLAKMWGVGCKELLQAATENMRGSNKSCILSLDTVLEGAEKYLGPDAIYFANCGMYVLTNEDRCLGASCMLDEDTIRSFAEEKDKDIYILPSSIHELILLPEFEYMDEDELQRTVECVNRAVVSPLEVLSDSVYVFRKNSGKYYRLGQEAPIQLEMAEGEKCS